MKLEEMRLKGNSKADSGGVSRFVLPDGKTSITRITTFCPDLIGPGPTHVHMINNDALIMVDAGIPTYLAKAYFYKWRNQPMPPEVAELGPDHSLQEFREGTALAGLSARDIDLLVISHGHADHFLLANAILNGCNAKVSAHILDTPEICNPWAVLNLWFSRRHQMVSTGMPPARTPKQVLLQEGMMHAFDLQSLGIDVKVDAPIFWEGPLQIGGSAVDGVEVIHLPGHSPGSVGLLVGREGEQRVLICGDVLLSPITPHPDDLLVYLQTLEELAKLENVALVMPAHGEMIRDLKARAVYLRDHHRHRLQLTYEACSEPRCVWDIASMPSYFETYVDPKEFNFLAGMEALVHMELLNMVGGLHRTQIKDQVHYFQNGGERFDDVYGRIEDLVASAGSRAIMRY